MDQVGGERHPVQGKNMKIIHILYASVTPTCPVCIHLKTEQKDAIQPCTILSLFHSSLCEGNNDCNPVNNPE